MTRSTAAALLLVSAFAWAGCAQPSANQGWDDSTPPGGPSSSEDGGTDGGPVVADAGLPSTDSGAAKTDAGALPASKGIWVWGSTVRGSESQFVAWATTHKYTDVFILMKGADGAVKYDVLSGVMKARPKGSAIRVWAWLTGFQDSSHTNPAWDYIDGDWIAPSDAVYQSYLAGIVKDAIDPSAGNVAEPPDGVMLDDSFEWPGASYGGSTATKVAALMAAVDAIKAQVDAAHTSTGKTIHLGFAPLPETTVVSSSSTQIVTDDAVNYGQDLGQIGMRCDWIAPETYRYAGFHPNASSWIGQVVSDIHKELTLEDGSRATEVAVYPALVLYESETTPTPVSASDLTGDLEYGKAAGGYSVFRYMSASANPGAEADVEDLPTAAQDTVLDGTAPPGDAGAHDASASAPVSNPLSPVVGYEQLNLTSSCGSCGSHSGAVCMGYLAGDNSTSTVSAIETDIYNTLPCLPGSSDLATAYTTYLGAHNLPWKPVIFQDSSSVLTYLQSGSPVVSHMTLWGGHYVVIYGLEGSSGAEVVDFSDGAYYDGSGSSAGENCDDWGCGNLKQAPWSTFLANVVAGGDFIGFVHQ